MIDNIEHRTIRGVTCELAVYMQGPPDGIPVVMTHSILSSSLMWDKQATLLADKGFRVIRIDTAGHGNSSVPAKVFTMDELAADTVAVLEALDIPRAHYVGLSLGGMSGFGLGVLHADRLLSLLLCDARADAPAAVAATWDDRIASAELNGSCAPLVEPTLERWFGKPFLQSHPEVNERFRSIANATSVPGFVGSARAIQSLNYIDHVGAIEVPTTLVVGANDGVLPETMRDLQTRISDSTLAVIPNAGHLPNVDQPVAFNEALMRHFERYSV